MARSLDEAYSSGYFQGSLSKHEILDRIQKKNDDARFHASKDYIGIWIRGRFIIGLPNISTHPKFTIFKYDPRFDRSIDLTTEDGEFIETRTHNFDPDQHKALARSWFEIFRALDAKRIEYNDENLF